MSGGVLVPVFVDRDRPLKGSLAVLSRAAELEREVTALVVGADAASDTLPALGQYGADTVVLVQGDPRSSAPWVAGAAQQIAAGGTSLVLLADGTLAAAVAGALAARCAAGLITGVAELRVRDGLIVAEKPVLRDRQIAVVQFLSALGIVVARQGAFTATHRAERPDAAVITADVPVRSGTMTTLSTAGASDPGRQLEMADVIVTGGRGLGGPEPFAEIEDLADALGALIGESAVGATRAVVDAGWRPVDAQVGLTGRAVSPKLYVAVAVSGAPQHRSGMERAAHILAINSDPRAPIFAIADLGVVADFRPLLPELTEALRTRAAAT